MSARNILSRSPTHDGQPSPIHLAPLTDWSAMGKSEHFVQFYEEDRFLVQSVAAFISAGFREGLRKLIERPVLRRQMGEIGRKHYEAKFTLEVMLRKTLAVYHKAVSSAQTAEDRILTSTRSSEAQADF